MCIRDSGTALKGFTIAGEDKVFHWADAVLQGTQVVLTCKDVQVPVAVRYNWADNPGGNLYNQEGLPAFSFRTDNWPVAPEILKTNLLINLEEIYK